MGRWTQRNQGTSVQLPIYWQTLIAFTDPWTLETAWRLIWLLHMGEEKNEVESPGRTGFESDRAHLALFVIYSAASLIVGLGETDSQPADGMAAAKYLLLVSFLFTIVLSYPIIRSR